MSETNSGTGSAVGGSAEKIFQFIFILEFCRSIDLVLLRIGCHLHCSEMPIVDQHSSQEKKNVKT